MVAIDGCKVSLLDKKWTYYWIDDYEHPNYPDRIDLDDIEVNNYWVTRQQLHCGDIWEAPKEANWQALCKDCLIKVGAIW